MTLPTVMRVGGVIDGFRRAAWSCASCACEIPAASAAAAQILAPPRPAPAAAGAAAPARPAAAVRSAEQRGDRRRVARLRNPVVVDDSGSVSGCPTLAVSVFVPSILTVGGLLTAPRTAGSRAERAGFRRLHDVVEQVVRANRRPGFFGDAVRRDGPDQFVLLGEIFRDRHAEDETIAAWQEMRRLSLIGPPGVKPFSGPGGMSISSAQFRFM